MHTPRRVTMMATLGGYLFTLIARRPLSLQGTRGSPGAAPAGQRELEPQDIWRPWSCSRLGSGSWSRRTCGGPGAALGWQRELEPQDTWQPRSCPGLGSGSWSPRTRGGPGAPRNLYAGVLGLQGTDSRSGRCFRSGDRKDIADRQNDYFIHFQKQFLIEFE
jgi:hypothetical protein